MPPYQLSSTSRALYRVFIAPHLNTLAKTPFLNIAKPSIASPRIAILQSHTPIRSKSYVKKDTARHALWDHYTLDLAISHVSPYINYIDADGNYHANISTTDALQSINRITHHLVLVSSGKVDENGRPDPENLPVCKAVSKISLREQNEKRLDIERRKSKGLGTGPSPKNMELNWAIAGGDLRHRLEKMKGFLREGRKVEVLFGPKRKGRKATDAECQTVLKAVRDAVGGCKGSSEAKEPEGTVGGVLTMVFQGRAIEKEADKGKRKDKKDKGEEPQRTEESEAQHV